MEFVELANKDNLIEIKLKGRIDSTNSESVEKEITECVQNQHSEVVLDAEKLEYISSAGLRVILRLRKNEPTLKVINASSEVYEIFEMTGFTEMIPVSKAYRTLSVEGCEQIGQGANGIVYRLDPDTIIKVYRNPDSLDEIHNERELARKAFIYGIPTAIPYDVVKVGNSYGSVFELLNAKSFAKLITEEPNNLDKYIKEAVDLLKKIHSTDVKQEDMPDMKEVAVDWVKFLVDYLPEDKHNKLTKLVNDVPVVHKMLHGDFHFKNIMLQNGEVLLIDMDTLCQGHPIFEFGGIYNAYQGFGDMNHENIESFLGIKYEQAKRIFEESVRLYLNTDDDNKISELREKAKLIGYTRLLRRTIKKATNIDDVKEQIEFYKKGLIELIDKVDTLLF